MRNFMGWRIVLAAALAVASGMVCAADSPERSIGERLFFETRFAQAFFAQCKGNVNASVPGDPSLNKTVAPGSPLPGPFAGKTMNCRACHLENEFQGVAGAGERTYADFARRTPIPDRGDGHIVTLRNTQSLVNTSIARQFFFLHFDGEFADGPSLVQGAFTGRNFGWLASEHDTAVKHIVKVIREDNGLGDLALTSGGAYAKVFAGDPSVSAAFLLPPAFRLDVSTATDAQIMQNIGNLVDVYMKSLVFSQDAAGVYTGSPYDVFLAKNKLPQKPAAKETNLDYSRRLRAALDKLTPPLFVTPADGHFTQHPEPFVFGPQELAGLKLFLAEPSLPLQRKGGRRLRATAKAPAPPPPPQGQGVGNCIACHAAPDFTDFLFHNTGVTQLEYDRAHGPGSFMNLKIPSLAERTANPADALPTTAAHPDYKGVFHSIPSPAQPGYADLGMWNVFANPDMPNSQKGLLGITKNLFGALSTSATLDKTVATFKTPGLRDLGHSQPYLHNGSQDTLRDVLDFYAQTAQAARNGQIRNADPEMARIFLTPEQSMQISRFLDSLNEDFTE